MYKLVGDPVKDSALLAEASPALHVGNSDQVVEALMKRGVAVDYMVKNDEGHGFANENNRLDFYRAMDKFFDKYLSGKPKEQTKQ